MAGFFVCVLLGGRYADAHGKLPVLLAGCVLMAVGSYVFTHVTTYPMAVLAIFLTGAGGGFGEGIATAVIADVFNDERRTSMMNCGQMFFAAGAVIGPLGVTWLLASKLDWRMAYMVTGVLCIVAALVAAAAFAKREERPLGHGHPGEWKALIKDPMVLTLSLGIMLYVGAETGQASWLAKYFKEHLGSAGPMAAATVALFWGGIGLGRLAATWTSKHLSDYAIICIAHGFAFVCQIALLITHSPISAFIAVLLLGFALGPGWPTIASRASAMYPRQSGTVVGIVVAASSLGAATFPATIGQAADHIGLWQALWICPILLIANVCIFLTLWKRQTN